MEQLLNAYIINEHSKIICSKRQCSGILLYKLIYAKRSGHAKTLLAIASVACALSTPIMQVSNMQT